MSFLFWPDGPFIGTIRVYVHTVQALFGGRRGHTFEKWQTIVGAFAVYYRS